MAYQIRAMSFSELLDTATRVLIDRFRLLVGITAVVYVPLAVINDGAQPEPGQIVWGRVIAGIVVSLVALPLASTALTHAVGETYLGHPTSIGRSFRAALRLILPLTGTMLLVYLGIIAGFVLLIIPGIYLSLAWILTSPIVILENQYGLSAIRRSRELMRGNMGRAAGVLILGWIVVAVLSGILGIVFKLVPVLGPIGQGFAQAVGVAYSSVVLVLLYFDIRCRKEAFDLEHLARLVESGATDVAA
jgi:hypothetical protein